MGLLLWCLSRTNDADLLHIVVNENSISSERPWGEVYAIKKNVVSVGSLNIYVFSFTALNLQNCSISPHVNYIGEDRKATMAKLVYFLNSL